MKRRVRKGYKKLPPHTYEAHPVANAGEASKPLIIGIIAIVAVIALSLLLLFSDQLVGKAFFTGEMNSAGAEVVPATVYENQPFSLKVKANTGSKETNVIGFELNLPSGINCANVQNIQNLLGWDVESKRTCVEGKTNDQIIFEYATFGAGKSGSFDVAQIDIVPGFAQGEFQFDFVSFQAFDSNNMNIITNVLDPTVEVKAAVSEVLPPPPTPEEAIPPTELQCVNAPSGLVSWWAAGKNDILGNNPWISFKAAGDTLNAKITQAFKFNGVDNYIEIADNPSLTPASFTIAAWINLENPAEGTIVSKSDVGGVEDSWDFKVSDPGQLRLRVVGGSIEMPSEMLFYSAESLFEANQWYYVVATYDSMVHAVKLYVNGQEVPVTTDPTNPSFGAPLDNTEPFRIGANKYNGGIHDFFKGFMDEIALWNRALTAQEIKSIYDADSAGMCLPTSAQVCGDGNKVSTEQCDDGNTMAGDGCTAQCIKECPNDVSSNMVEGGCVCVAPNELTPDGRCKYVVTTQTCGNGVKEGTEQCDDNNIMDGDGCSAGCQTEQQICTVNAFSCDGDTQKQCNQWGTGYISNVDCVALGMSCLNNECVVTGETPTSVCTANTWSCEGTTAKKQCKSDGSGYNAPVNCVSGETCSNGACTALPPPPPPTPAEEPQPEGVTIQGTKITLTDIAPANDVFATKITAKETFTNEVTVYTILYSSTGKVLSIKSEKLENGLAKDAAYTATVNYPETNVKKKSVIVYDIKQNPTVFGSLEVEKS